MTIQAWNMLARDCDTLEIVADHERIFQLRLHEAAKVAQTDDAIDAIADLSNQLSDLMSEFKAVQTRLTNQANRANDRNDWRQRNSLRAAE